MSLDAIVLAGGRGARVGGAAKPLFRLDGETLLARAAAISIVIELARSRIEDEEIVGFERLGSHHDFARLDRSFEPCLHYAQARFSFEVTRALVAENGAALF